MLTQVGGKEPLVQLSLAGNLEDARVALSPSRPCALEKVSGKGKRSGLRACHMQDSQGPRQRCRKPPLPTKDGPDPLLDTTAESPTLCEEAAAGCPQQDRGRALYGGPGGDGGK